MSKIIEVGDIVKPTKESGYTLRCGSGMYGAAVVISVAPFILVSEETDMRWSATVQIGDFEIVGKTTKKHLKKCMRRIND